MPSRFSLSERLYRALLSLFPADFRGDFGSEMEEVFRDQRREAELKGKIGLLRLWGSTLAGALRIGPREHWDMLRQDAGYAVRMMRRNPAFTAVAALVLAFGIGANTAVFSLVNGALLQPLPYANDRQLVFLRQQAPKAGIDSLGFSPNELADYRRQNQTLSDLVEYHSMSFILLGRDEPEQVQTGVVSANFFDVLGVKPLLGRTFLPHEEHTGAEPVLVLSYDYWQRSHGGDRNIVGRVFKMNDRSHMVIGVLPPVPQFPQENDVYMAVPACPFRSNPRNIEQRTFRLVSVFGRLRSEAQLPQAQADLSTAAARMAAQYPEAYPAGGGFAIRATALKEELTQNARLTFLILLGTAGLVLLIACANVANLMLARVLAREREMAVRAAIGASRGRLVRQMVTESMILALAGGAAGLLLAAGSVTWLIRDRRKTRPVHVRTGSQARPACREENDRVRNKFNRANLRRANGPSPQDGESVFQNQLDSQGAGAASGFPLALRENTRYVIPTAMGASAMSGTWAGKRLNSRTSCLSRVSFSSGAFRRSSSRICSSSSCPSG